MENNVYCVIADLNKRSNPFPQIIHETSLLGVFKNHDEALDYAKELARDLYLHYTLFKVDDFIKVERNGLCGVDIKSLSARIYVYFGIVCKPLQ